MKEAESPNRGTDWMWGLRARGSSMVLEFLARMLVCAPRPLPRRWGRAGLGGARGFEPRSFRLKSLIPFYCPEAKEMGVSTQSLEVFKPV